MTILLLLIPLSLMLVGIAAWAFAWAVRRGQFDDLDTSALDILSDDDRDVPVPVPVPVSVSVSVPVSAAHGDGDAD